jgi:hypothetical protein
VPSGNYRYYYLDGTGNLYGAEWFDATSDEEAIGYVEAKHPGCKCEIWEGSRLVANLFTKALSA